MKWYRQTLDEAVDKLASSLLHELKKGKTVLWLLSGGSNIDVACKVMKKLEGHERNLIVSLIDERYGEIGHDDSNWQQLLGAGFRGGDATLYPVLQPGLSLAATTRMFELTLQDCLDKVDVSIGLLGMGNDGHTAGILPNSEAATATASLVTSYRTEQFDRITMTFNGLQKLDKVFLLAYGHEKKSQLAKLQDEELALATQPVQIVKQLKHVYVYNDQLGEPI